MEVGSQVSAGDVAGLIEIMKNFYELLAPIDGFLDEGDHRGRGNRLGPSRTASLQA